MTDPVLTNTLHTHTHIYINIPFLGALFKSTRGHIIKLYICRASKK